MKKHNCKISQLRSTNNQ